MRKAAKSPAPEETPAGLAYDGLDELLGFRIRFAHTAMYRDFAASLEDLDLTQKQVGSLWLISANPGVSQAALAAALSMDRATMMSIIDRLENGGLVVRKRSVSDRRRQELHLTPAGQKTLAKARNAIARHERRFASRLSADEFTRLLSALRKIA
jgi:DNA-binding MarR family transcriptional regulator